MQATNNTMSLRPKQNMKILTLMRMRANFQIKTISLQHLIIFKALTSGVKDPNQHQTLKQFTKKVRP